MLICKWLPLLILLLSVIASGIPARCYPSHPPANAGNHIQKRENILVLHSYSQDFAWTRSQQDGIDSVFGPLSSAYEVRIEYLDAVHHPELLKGSLLLDLLRTKLSVQQFRVVLTSDNAAFNFARAHRAELFPAASIVFMGVNGYDDSMLRGERGITGVAEDTDLAGTLRVILQLMPQTKLIVFPGMTDDITYRAIRSTVAGELHALPPGFKTDFPEYPDVDAALDALRTLPPDAAIVIMSNMRTRNGEGISSQRVVELVSAAAPVPVFTNWDFVVGHGAVGGSVISGVEQGRQAAEIAVQVLRGELPESIPVRRGAGKTLLFDFRQLTRFGIPASRLPEKSQVLFAPERLLKISRETAWAVGISFMLMLGVTVSLVLSVRRRRRAEEEVRAINRKLESANSALETEVAGHRRAEERLRQSEQFLDSVVENIPDMIFVKEAETLRFVRFNNYGEQLLGYRREMLLGKSDYDLFPKEEADFFSAKDREVLASGALVDIPEEPIQTKEKGERILRTKKIPILDKDGSPRYLLGISEDITERRRAEEELRRNLEQQKALLEVYQNMPSAQVHEVIAFVVDRCVHLTGSAIGFVGLVSDDDMFMEAHIWSEKAMENCPINKPLAFPISDAGLWAESIRQRKAIIVNEYKEPNPLKKGYPKGHLELTRFMGVPVVDNDRVVAVVGVANKSEHYAESDQFKISLLLKGVWDIVKRKRAEESLKDNEARYRALFEGVPDALLIADIATGLIRNVNQSACRLFARTRDELIGVHQATLHPPRLAHETEQSFREHSREAAEGKPGAPFEHVILRADGSEIPIEIRTQPVMLDGAKMILGVFRDISERKRAEEALRMLNSELEERVKERTAALAAKNTELERANRLFIGRELRMVELKERIRELESKTGERGEQGG